VLSLVHVLEWRAAVHPGSVAISDHRGAALTYAELAAATEQATGGFAAAGVAPGDVVPIVARNQVGWVTAMLGLIRAGALPAAVNCPVPVLTVPGASGDGERAAPPERPVARLRPAEPAVLVHTSGTTGRPKLVTLTHQQLIAAAAFMTLEVPEAGPGARHLSALPLFHVAGLANLGYVLFSGGHLHALGGFDPAGFVDELVRRRIQLTQLVPTLIQAVAAEVNSRSAAPDLSQLIEVVYGASPIRPEVLERAVAVLGCRFRQNYASSETGPLPITSLPPEDHDPLRGRLGTAGKPSLGWEVRLGERGEVQVRGAAPLPGYWNDTATWARSLTSDGFYRTGDVGAFDADGYLTIIDRLNDLVITGGENVFPAEVEAVLAQHPAVADVAVIGIPDDRWGEIVHAVVVAAPGFEVAGFDAAGLTGWARERLAGFKCPTGVTLVPELPRNATGKVLRAALREPFWAGRDRLVS
jgi:long-chain acyl-CoA synthetase